jgi:hypothetical protein
MIGANVTLRAHPFNILQTERFAVRAMNLIDVLGPFVVLMVVIFAVVGIYLRQGRNHVLEKMIAQREGGSLAAFRGTLVVEESGPRLLRLRKSTAQAQCLQFRYRWLVGIGRQAILDEVTFDASRRLVELRKSDKYRNAPRLQHRFQFRT